MDIHTPRHPVHGWHELLKEVGIIVLGVLIALGAEQSVEAWHWHRKVADAEQAMRLELRDDDAPQAITRLALATCLDAQLDSIQAAIETGRDRRVIAALVSNYTPPARTWDSEAWTTTVASDVGSHSTADRMVTWSLPYRLVPLLQSVNLDELAETAQLEPTRSGAGPLTTQEADRMLVADHALRADNQTMAHRSGAFLVGVQKNGASLSESAQTGILNELRKHYGSCVAAPSLKNFDPTDQLNGLRQK
jgi:hypothetical protein